jgi:hypothetical protein
MHNVRRLLGFAAFLALPLLWPSAAAAVRSVSCEIDATDVGNLHGFKTNNNAKFAVECQGEGIVIAGEATTTANRMTLQVRLRTLTGTSATGTTQAIGYGSNRQPIANCFKSDSTLGAGYEQKACGATIEYLTLSADGFRP